MKNIPITKRVSVARSGITYPANQEVTKNADGTGGPVDNVAKQTTKDEFVDDKTANYLIEKGPNRNIEMPEVYKSTYAEKLGKKLGVKTKKTKTHEDRLKDLRLEGWADRAMVEGRRSPAKDYKKGYYGVGKQTEGRTEEEQKEREKFDIDTTNREEVVDYLMTEKGMDPVEADSMYNEGGFTYEDYKKETKPPKGVGKDYKKGYYGVGKNYKKGYYGK